MKQNTSQEGTDLKGSKEQGSLTIGINVKPKSVGMISHHRETVILSS